MDIERVKQKYQRNARLYDLLVRRPTVCLRARAIERMALRPGEAALDFGCGTGLSFELLEHAVGPEGRIVGADVSSDMLARARGKVMRYRWANATLHEGFPRWRAEKKKTPLIARLLASLPPLVNTISSTAQPSSAATSARAASSA